MSSSRIGAQIKIKRSYTVLGTLTSKEVSVTKQWSYKPCRMVNRVVRSCLIYTRLMDTRINGIYDT